MYFQQQGKFQPLDQVVIDSDYPNCPLLLNCADVKPYIHHITEVKGEKKGLGQIKKKKTGFLSVTSLQDRLKYWVLLYQTPRVLNTAIL